LLLVWVFIVNYLIFLNIISALLVWVFIVNYLIFLNIISALHGENFVSI